MVGLKRHHGLPDGAVRRSTFFLWRLWLGQEHLFILWITAILHTHTRKLNYHPHVHIIVPGGGVTKNRNQWREMNGKYLFNGFKLAAVFRGKMLNAIEI